VTDTSDEDPPEAKPPRKTNLKYRPEFCDIARELSKNGATDLEMSAHLGIGFSTFYQYCQRFPEFAAAVRVGKEVADDRVESTLYRRATGYMVEEEKAFFDRKTNKIFMAVEKKHIPPEPNCIKLWLSNRRPDLWRDITRQEVTGANGGPVTTHNFTEVEVARRVAFMLRTGEMAIDVTPEPALIEQKPKDED
jgi:hypothetical protein